jgi:hypothetical protein
VATDTELRKVHKKLFLSLSLSLHIWCGKKQLFTYDTHKEGKGEDEEDKLTREREENTQVFNRIMDAE